MMFTNTFNSYLFTTIVAVSAHSSCQDWEPHPSGDCHRYIRCVGVSIFVKKCPANLYFNPGLRVCDWPSNVTCGNNTHVTPMTRPVTTPAHVSPKDRAFSCPKGVEWGRFPDLDSNCQQFFECEKGRCSIGSCPPGLLFNILVISCDLPENTVCPNFHSKPVCL